MYNKKIKDILLQNTSSKQHEKKERNTDNGTKQPNNQQNWRNPNKCDKCVIQPRYYMN